MFKPVVAHFKILSWHKPESADENPDNLTKGFLGARGRLSNPTTLEFSRLSRIFRKLDKQR
jgi:hypothetical protein